MHRALKTHKMEEALWQREMYEQKKRNLERQMEASMVGLQVCN
jgi:hypothetical protein